MNKFPYGPAPAAGVPPPHIAPYVVWICGVIFIGLAVCLVASVIYIALLVYRDAQTRRTWPVFWLVVALLGGWLGALAWFVVRDRYPDLILEQITSQTAPTSSTTDT